MEHFPYFLDFELQGLREFLDHSWKSPLPAKVEQDEELEERDFEKLLTRQKLATKLVYYELNVIIEREIYDCATDAWKESPKYSSQTIMEGISSGKPISSNKFIEDLPIKDAVQLIENKYNTTLAILPNYDFVFSLREIVNSFKHRQGFVDFRKKPLTGKSRPLKRYNPSIESAYDAIYNARAFIFALWGIEK